MSENNIKAVAEALLFSSEKPLTLEQIRKAMDNLSLAEVRLALDELRNEYEQSRRGLRIAEVAGGYMMVTAQDFAPFLKKLYKDRRTERLSKPALETLAIIAYKQPITKLEIEMLRSVNVDGVMKSLLDKSLIRVAGRKKAAGRPFVFGTSRQFMEYFGLKSLEDLPKVEEFASMDIKREAGEIELDKAETAEETDGPKEAAQADRQSG